MFPGGRANPRQMQMMMKKLGMSTEPVDDVEEVIVRTKKDEHVIRNPEVTILVVQGVRTYQIVGDVEVRARSAATSAASSSASATPSGPPPVPEEDIALVMDQAEVDRDEAIAALRASDGAPAEAILRLLSHRGNGGG